MKVFFDEEFTGLHKGTTLISIGLTAENGDSFYGEITDYDKEQVDDFVEKHVLPYLSKSEEDLKKFARVTIKDTRFMVQHALWKWIDELGPDEIQFVSDVCHYDFVLLIDFLWGNATLMPKNISAVCHDINQDIAAFYQIPDKQAFDISREEFLTHFGIDGDHREGIKAAGLYYTFNELRTMPVGVEKELSVLFGVKHNSMHDAVVIKFIYKILERRLNTLK